MTVLLNCRAIAKSFGSEFLFEDLDLTVFEGDRLGIIGPNGAGKSTLLKILAGLETVEEGEIILRKGVRLAYVPQLSVFELGRTVLEILTEAAETARVPDPEAAVNVTLGKVGFEDPNAEAASLSGGWQKRITLARGLVRQPHIMLLDEPTNHLDAHGILWLEQILARAPFTWILVSHDRYFLDRTVSKVAELNRVYPDGLFTVEGSYRAFSEKKDAFLKARTRYKDALANKVTRETEWLQRGPKARTTKARARIDEAGRLMAELEQVRSSLRTHDARISFSATDRKTKKLAEFKNIAKTLAGKKIINGLNLLLSPGTRLGLLGGNGAGKTTVLKLVAGELQPDSGSVRHAPDLGIVYFDQNREELNPEWSLKRALSETGDSVIFQGRSIHVMSWARRFRFHSDQLPIPVGKLSGGEQARLSIARLMLRPADVLLLDEPTNDLDLPTLEILEEGLSEFAGALVLVTHDRFMLSRLCSSFIGLDGRGGCTPFADYPQWERTLRDSATDRSPKSNTATSKPKSKPKRLSYKLQREYDAMEECILLAETDLETHRSALEDPVIATDSVRLGEAYTALKEAEALVDRLYERWSELEAMQTP